MLIKKSSVLFLSFLFQLFVDTNGDSQGCSSKDTCGSCIRSLGCVWCSQTNLSDVKRCFSEVDIDKVKWCHKENIVNPTSRIEIVQNKTLSTGDGKDAVQITPQKIKLTLRVGEEKTIAFKYQQAVGYPLDLYYLMDMSASMADDKTKLSVLASKLISTMKSITNNFRIGFGSFVDKVELPYTSTIPAKLAKPCVVPITNQSCAPPYSFKNNMPLNDDTNLFAKKVEETRVSGNLDYPEGGFDGLMQVLVCDSNIRWREKARKLVVFSTDADFHLAGDGKLAGIVEPNDGACHLDSNGTYTHSLLMDYPSISMLDTYAREKGINIIFAAPKAKRLLYTQLRDSIHGAAFGILSNDSSNVVDLIKAEYDKLVDSVYFSDNAKGSIDMKYFSSCLGTQEKQTKECLNLKGRPELSFKVVLKAVNCPNNKDKWQQTINIIPGTLNERLSIDVEIICECECEASRPSTKAKECHDTGTLQCGICSCDDATYGKFCECNGNDTSTFESQKGCKPDNTTETCSGLGVCKCGKCDCNQRDNPDEKIYGSYCECDNYSCKRSGGLICSGPDKGRCDCGRCLCESGWSGSACECEHSNATCIAPGSNEVCSGHGVCTCGACQCDAADKFRYSGQYCEECPHCSETKCTQLKDCVECQVHKTGKYSESECSLKCTTFQSEVLHLVEVNKDNDTYAEKLCKIPDDAGCLIIFKYMYEDDNISYRVQAQKAKECSKPLDILGIMLGVVGSIVVAGLVMLVVWKVVTSVHDKKEYQRFERERLMAKWDRGDNPLYKPSTSLFSNPTFKGQ